ncbi:hypothetical protein L596_009480 [Steinernema carpocapsae]|uniref:Attacin C-terminal domain-containing protein n=1 Tax=Steinernema carpocapsae TaxID=34508 RepID=A0A4U5PG94_STECR|nr:hypothetical protein L596_009480 [Steinernema carpocapsae]
MHFTLVAVLALLCAGGVQTGPLSPPPSDNSGIRIQPDVRISGNGLKDFQGLVGGTLSGKIYESPSLSVSPFIKGSQTFSNGGFGQSSLGAGFKIGFK